MIGDDRLREWIIEATARLLELVDDLQEEQLRVPYLPTVNPILWELCHTAYFIELWVLRRGAGREAWRDDVDALFDSTTIAHETRWSLPVPEREDAVAYVRRVRERVLEELDRGLSHPRGKYWTLYSVYHTDMHTEALTYTRQALGYRAPELKLPTALAPASPGKPGDAAIPGGTLSLGAPAECSFCFDNEKSAHPVQVEPFEMARTVVSEGEYQTFVMEGGYERSECWSLEGWAWRQATQAELPLYWRRSSAGTLESRHFDRWRPLEQRRAMVHVCWYEAQAYCRWAKRRLPSEAEWEAAAALDGDTKRHLPWGEDDGGSERCNTDWISMGPVDVSAFPLGDSPSGCRQMIGNVWEWTDTTFLPYPAFTPDMYSDYSQTSFHTRKVLRGGSWATRSRMMRNTLRNFFQPTRRDIFAGFRTCALG